MLSTRRPLVTRRSTPAPGGPDRQSVSQLRRRSKHISALNCSATRVQGFSQSSWRGEGAPGRPGDRGETRPGDRGEMMFWRFASAACAEARLDSRRLRYPSAEAATATAAKRHHTTRTTTAPAGQPWFWSGSQSTWGSYWEKYSGFVALMAAVTSGSAYESGTQMPHLVGMWESGGSSCVTQYRDAGSVLHCW